MKEYGGWMFPDHELHLPQWLNKAGVMEGGRLAYQHRKMVAALKHCTHKRVALDVGGHVGLWSFYLAKQFGMVHAFEPVSAHRECFAVNVTANNVELHACALGAAAGAVSISTENGSSGNSFINGGGDIPLLTLDSVPDLGDVDFIKIDTEGSELLVLRGAEETISRCRPVVIVEQKPGHAQRFGLGETAAVDYLSSRGYRLVDAISGDYILVPKL